MPLPSPSRSTPVQLTPPSVYADAWRSRLLGAQPVEATRLCPPPDGHDGSVLVVVAHPDDEVLAMGATIAALGAQQVPVDVVSLTSGEGALDHVGRRVDGLAAIRRAELAEAGRRLGVRTATADGWPDSRLADHVEAATDDLLATGARPSHVLTLWRDDPHPDHRAASAVARALGRALDVGVTELLLWAVHWTDPDVVSHDVRPVATGEPARRARRAALAAYTSQTTPLQDDLEPVLPPSVVAWDQECVVVQP